jgi:uncharacterized protein with PIN domain
MKGDEKMKYKCPYCNVELEIDDRVNIDIDEQYVESEMEGHCPECDRIYTWYDSYEYKESYKLTLVD